MDVNRDLMEKQRALEEDLKAAAAIQESLLSTQDHQVDGVRIASRFRPCEAVGGDIFSVSQLGKGHLAVSMIDVSGHGVPATMLSVSLARTLSPEAGNIIKPGSPPTPPSVVMRTLDEKYPIERFDKHFTICYLLFDCTTGRVRYTRAGHPMPVIQRADGSFQVLDAGGTVIGLGSDLPFEEREAQLSLGDRIFLYSDGLVELESPDGAPYGEERFLHELRACRGATLDDACNRILESLRVFADGRPAKDDITLLALEYECASGARGAGKDPDRSH
ncbi:MAG: PP2C family protein-serine/threonine phosphatase [Candidatus Krumholzibacteriia bacterium]